MKSSNLTIGNIMSLMGSLGLENVEADPNRIPDGKYKAVVFKSEYVYLKDKNQVSHVITYKVTEGDRKGAQKAEWFPVGKDPVFKEGAKEIAQNIVSVTPNMSEQTKPWYKKRFVDLGVNEKDVPTTDIASLVGKEVTLGMKTKDGWSNISFVELINGEPGATAEAAPTSTQAVAQPGQVDGGLTGSM